MGLRGEVMTIFHKDNTIDDVLLLIMHNIGDIDNYGYTTNKCNQIMHVELNLGYERNLFKIKCTDAHHLEQCEKAFNDLIQDYIDDGSISVFDDEQGER